MKVKTETMSHMLTEINEQPQWVERALMEGRDAAVELALAMRDRDIRQVVIAARGTSDNAATYAKYLFEILARIPVSLAAPSVLTLYDAQLQLQNTLVLGISQSGQGADIVQVLSAARAAGGLTACITNSSGSNLTTVCDHVLLCHAGEEKSVAATKSYTTSLAIVALLVAEFTGSSRLRTALKSIANDIHHTLPVHVAVAHSVERYRYMEECAILARGINQATALEAAIKMTETCYVVAKPWSGADFMHGPIALVDSGFPCFLFVPPGRAYASMLELAVKIRSRSGEMVIISSEDEILTLATKAIKMDVTVDEFVSPLMYIVPGQFFAHSLAGIRGIDPDKPRGLSKVTSTR